MGPEWSNRGQLADDMLSSLMTLPGAPVQAWCRCEKCGQAAGVPGQHGVRVTSVGRLQVRQGSMGCVRAREACGRGVFV